jgi:hypothetical protein
MSFFQFPKYFWLFLIFVFFSKNWGKINKGEHIFSAQKIIVSITFFGGFPVSLFFGMDKVWDKTSTKCQRFTKIG